MRLDDGETARAGRVVDARDLNLSRADAVAAIRRDATAVTVECPEPGPAHERVGDVHPEIGVSIRTALAAAARSRGHTAPQADRIAEIESELAELTVPTASTRPERAAVADRADDVERLDERVAELRGRVQALRERDAETDDVEADLAAAIQEFTAAKTDLIAARENHEAATEAARAARDARERRMELEDRLANRRRAARASLADGLTDEYREAVAVAPWETPTDPFQVGDVTAALAVARVADLRAPVVLSCDRFADPATAADWLDAAVLRL
ncbi:hypothetical protein SAMN05216388_1004170 [Halorientalis persicus]|uniref:Uncharacterized protein n=1 Tax=Halorientalis persicus TaxID=1367881 RepID=A0A1H8IHU4_9EURY|nr:hypothetical protein [Halorientalis persicus]SEN67941.1 hypothetical protein SAMN05216388_1004170 [Halorientalis persicus]